MAKTKLTYAEFCKKYCMEMLDEVSPEAIVEPEGYLAILDDGGEVEGETKEEVFDKIRDIYEEAGQKETFWVRAGICRVFGVTDKQGEKQTMTIDWGTELVSIHPPEPPCWADEHSWSAPRAIVGGIESNPGVYGHGGGVVMHEVCKFCGRYRTIDTWAQDRETGTQGLRSVEYRDADDESEPYSCEGVEDCYRYDGDTECQDEDTCTVLMLITPSWLGDEDRTLRLESDELIEKFKEQGLDDELLKKAKARFGKFWYVELDYVDELDGTYVRLTFQRKART
jgi:hypothetical protein